MNAIVAIRHNKTGLLSPTPATRQSVADQLKSITKTSAGTGPSSVLKMTEGAESGRADSLTLDRDAFLRLLVLELQNQDPLSPMNNREMITQLATFASLEQMQSLNAQLEVVSGSMDQLNFISANSLVGKGVRGVGIDGSIVEGEVEGVQLDGNIVLLRVDGTTMPMTGVLEIFQPDDIPAPDTEK